MSASNSQRRAKKLTPRQRVLKKYPRATVRWFWPGVWWVMASRSADDSLATGARTPAAAWIKTAKEIFK